MRPCRVVLWFFVCIFLSRDARVYLQITMKTTLTNMLLIHCDFGGYSKKSIKTVTILRHRLDSRRFTVIAYYTNESTIDYDTEGRSVAPPGNVYLQDNSMVLIFYRIVCSLEGMYLCRVRVQGERLQEVSEQVLVSAPSTQIKLSLFWKPNKKSFVSGERVTFTCRAGVGKPPGTLWWFIVSEKGRLNVTEKADESSPFYAGDKTCSLMMNSTLTVRADMPVEIVVECRVYIPHQLKNMNVCSSETFCMKSDHLKVLNTTIVTTKTDSSRTLLIACAAFAVVLVLSMYMFHCLKRRGKDAYMDKESDDMDQSDISAFSFNELRRMSAAARRNSRRPSVRSHSLTDYNRRLSTASRHPSMSPRRLSTRSHHSRR